MPKRWKDLLDPEPSGGGVEYLPDGFRTPFPSLNAGEVCQVQYVLAWGPEREDGYDARWAIELSPQQILDGGPCR